MVDNRYYKRAWQFNGISYKRFQTLTTEQIELCEKEEQI